MGESKTTATVPEVRSSRRVLHRILKFSRISETITLVGRRWVRRSQKWFLRDQERSDEC